MAAGDHRDAGELAELGQHRHRLVVAARGDGDHHRVLRLEQVVDDFLDALGIGRGGPCDAELRRGRIARAVERHQRDFLREAHIDRTRRLAGRDLDRAADHEARVILVLEPLVPFHILPDDAVLVPLLLRPEMRAIARAADRAGIGRRRRAGGHDHRKAGAPGGMDGAAVMLGAAIDMGGRGRRPAADRGEAERRVEADMLQRAR